MSGWFGLLGSGEFQPWSAEVDEWLLARATGDGTVLVIPTASAPEGEESFENWSRLGLLHYESAGIPVELLPVHDRVDADDRTHAERVASASLVFCSGGNPAYLAATLSNTLLWRAITTGLDRGMGYAGCSAGMACLGRSAPDSTVGELGDDLWRPGLGLFPRAWLGPHWNMLDQYAPGLIDHIVAGIATDDVLLGVDEETAVVGDGRDWLVVGAGHASVFDGSEPVTHGVGANFHCDLLS